MYIALIKVGISPTEREGWLLPSSSHVLFFLQAGGVSQLPARTGGENTPCTLEVELETRA